MTRRDFVYARSVPKSGDLGEAVVWRVFALEGRVAGRL